MEISREQGEPPEKIKPVFKAPVKSGSALNLKPGARPFLKPSVSAATTFSKPDGLGRKLKPERNVLGSSSAPNVAPNYVISGTRGGNHASEKPLSIPYSSSQRYPAPSNSTPRILASGPHEAPRFPAPAQGPHQAPRFPAPGAHPPPRYLNYVRSEEKRKSYSSPLDLFQNTPDVELHKGILIEHYSQFLYFLFDILFD